MNKLALAVVLGLGVSLPMGAMASPDEEVTIRVMQMNENTSDNVTRYIELPDAASDQATENAQTRERVRERVRDRANQQDADDGDQVQERIMEQEREQDMAQERERMMEQDHENMQEPQRDMPDGQDSTMSGNHGPM